MKIEKGKQYIVRDEPEKLPTCHQWVCGLTVTVVSDLTTIGKYEIDSVVNRACPLEGEPVFRLRGDLLKES